jgi:hypothetical protein
MFRRLATPGLAAAVVVGLMLSGLLIGWEPVGGDPDTLYRPIKTELARALRAGHLPFWSDRFGLGVPLLAESHTAALYPLNWLFYGLLDVAVAYRLAMWLHHLALAVTTYAYARYLGGTPWGGAISALAFTLCGFQNIHAGHEPFYHALPYLPLALLLAERYLDRGRLSWMVLLALVYGLQLTLGHFQLQFWTGGLVLLTGLWRAAIDGKPWRRAAGLALALIWGGAMASVQLALTWELTRQAGFDRPALLLSNYLFPPAHWAQLAWPRLFMGLIGGPEDSYWGRQQTTGAEACCYIGTVPLILAFAGFAAGRHRGLAPWKWIIPATLVLATLPRWAPAVYGLILNVPGLGSFRCPARYTVLSSLGLCLWAGRGFDRAIAAKRFAAGLALAIAFGAAAAAWGWSWATHSELGARLGPGALPWRLGEAGLAWASALLLLALWRARWAPAGVVLGSVAFELGLLYYAGPVRWGWHVALPAESPALRLLTREPGARLIAGKLEDIPVAAGLTTAFPYLGITPPPPNYLLEAARSPEASRKRDAASWLQRFGVTHGIWEEPFIDHRTTTLYQGHDLALDRVVPRAHDAPPRTLWRVVRYPDPQPAARVATRVREAAGWPELYACLSRPTPPEEVWYMAEDRPLDGPGPRARTARVVSYNGRTAVVEHDGDCDLVITRTYYLGWMFRINGGPLQPVLKADGGLQAVRLVGEGPTRVVFVYHPTGLRFTAILALTATSGALGVLAFLAWKGF